MNMFEAKIASARIRGSGTRWDKEYLVVLFLLVIAFWLLVEQVLAISPAAAQTRTPCGDHRSITESLARSYSERPHAIGLSADGKLFEVLVSETGSWTILITFPSRRTCLVAAGESWESIPAAAVGSSM